MLSLIHLDAMLKIWCLFWVWSPSLDFQNAVWVVGHLASCVQHRTLASSTSYSPLLYLVPWHLLIVFTWHAYLLHVCMSRSELLLSCLQVFIRFCMFGLPLPSACWTLSPSAFYVGRWMLTRLTTCIALDQFNARDLFSNLLDFSSSFHTLLCMFSY